MKSLYRKFVRWLASDIIDEERQSAFDNGTLLERGRQQMEEGRERILKEFSGKFPLLTTRQNEYGNPEIIIKPSAALRRYPEVIEDAEQQFGQAIAEGWQIALTTGTMPMEF